MNKFILTCAVVSVLLSLSACSSTDGSNQGSSTHMTNTVVQSLVPFPDTTIGTTQRAPLGGRPGQP